jgi:hypothetical protein
VILAVRATVLGSHGSNVRETVRGRCWSGRRGSNPRPTAWEAVTLPLSYSRPVVSLDLSRSRTGRVGLMMRREMCPLGQLSRPV